MSVTDFTAYRVKQLRNKQQRDNLQLFMDKLPRYFQTAWKGVSNLERNVEPDARWMYMNFSFIPPNKEGTEFLAMRHSLLDGDNTKLIELPYAELTAVYTEEPPTKFEALVISEDVVELGVSTANTLDVINRSLLNYTLSFGKVANADALHVIVGTLEVLNETLALIRYYEKDRVLYFEFYDDTYQRIIILSHDFLSIALHNVNLINYAQKNNVIS